MRRISATFIAVLLVTAVFVPASVAGASAATHGKPEDCGFPYTATDASGTEVTIEQKPKRVTTLAPSAAQTMWEIGGKSQVVGRTKFSAYLDGAANRTNVSTAGGFGVSVERIVGTQPDLVLAPNVTDSATIKKLREAGVTVFVFEKATSIDSVTTKTTLMGRLTGNCDGAKEANAWMNQNVDAVRNATQGVDSPRVLYPLGGGFVVGNGTFIDEIISTSGGTNVVSAAGIADYPKLSDERILALRPEVIITTEANSYLIAEEPYASTPAGKNNSTVSVNVNYLNQPAPRSVVYATRNLTTGLHPDVQVDAVAKSEVSIDTATKTETEAHTETATTTESTPTSTDSTEVSQPGFGFAAALAAFIGGLVVLAGRLD